MDEEWTCGKGMAASAWLPARLADLLDAMADTLTEHRAALDVNEPAGRGEDDAYAAVVGDYREIVSRLKATAAHLEGLRDLPMGFHDPEKMADPARMAPYARFVAQEGELAKLLESAAAEGEAMLR